MCPMISNGPSICRPQSRHGNRGYKRPTMAIKLELNGSAELSNACDVIAFSRFIEKYQTYVLQSEAMCCDTGNTWRS